MKQKRYIKTRDLMRLTLPPMAFLFVCLLSVIAISFLTERNRSNTLLNTKLESIIEKQSYNFLEEAYLQQADAIELRVGFILDELQSMLRGRVACLDVTVFSRDGIDEQSVFKCSNNKAENKIDSILTKTVPLRLGSQDVGVITYGLANMDLLEATVALKYLAATIFAFIMSLGFLYIFIIRIRNQIVRPLLQEIQQSARDEATVEIAKQIAHDIRSPLSALGMVANLSTALPEDHKKLMITATDRIQNMANELLEKSKLESDSQEVNLASTGKKKSDLNKNIEELLLEKKISNSYKKVAIKHEYVGNSEIICKPHDLLELKRIISNIINNSVEAIFEQGQVKVKTTTQESSVQIQVSDNGQGMAEEILSKVGTKGFTHGKEDGNGLGLFYAIRRVESWGGSLKINSTPGLGTTVTITLPKTLAQNELLKPTAPPQAFQDSAFH